MGKNSKSNLAFNLLLWMTAGVLIVSIGFYFLVNLQTREIKGRIFDKAKLFSLILGANLDKIVGDNLNAYRELSEAAYFIKRTHKEVEVLRVILPELLIISSSNKKEVYTPLKEEYRYSVKKVIKEKKPVSTSKKISDKELVFHYLPLFTADSSGKLMGVMQIVVEFPSVNTQLVHSLRIDRSSYFKKEASLIANDLARMLRRFLIEVHRNFSYFENLINNILSDEEIYDVKIFLKDLNILISGSSRKKVGFLAEENPSYEKVMESKKLLVSKVSGAKGLEELISPLYLTVDGKKKIVGVVSVVLSLKKVNSYVFQRRITLIWMSIAMVSMFCLIIILFFKQKILDPLGELCFLAQKVGEGDFSVRSQINSSDELGRLALSFNLMIEKLKRYKEETESWNMKLQEKIEEVTKELKEKQSQLLESEKIASLGILSSGIAHQINNPLGIILGDTQMLLKKLSTKEGVVDSKEAEELLKDIEENIKRCSKIINSLLQFGRRKELQFQEVVINDIINSSLKFVEPSLLKKDAVVITDINPNIKILADPIQLEQVFVNIILNATQSIEVKGQIRIVSEIRNLPEGDFLCVVFEDNGRGIFEEDLKKVFDPFFSTKDVSEGAGLGLSVSYGIIKAHKGDIEIKSKEKEGTTVIVKLPLRKPD